jgi:hypothetical protein
MERSQRFLRDSKGDQDPRGDQPPQRKVGYRNAVMHNRQRIGYPPAHAPPQHTGNSLHEPLPEDPWPPEPSLDETSSETPSFHQSIVDHSLIWRMVGWLGSLTFALDKACRMILQRNPNSLCHRFASSVNPVKARSDHRLASLETADHLLHVIEEWEATFGEKFFPRFATRAGFD